QQEHRETERSCFRKPAVKGSSPFAGSGDGISQRFYSILTNYGLEIRWHITGVDRHCPCSDHRCAPPCSFPEFEKRLFCVLMFTEVKLPMSFNQVAGSSPARLTFLINYLKAACGLALSVCVPMACQHPKTGTFRADAPLLAASSVRRDCKRQASSRYPHV